MSTRYASLGMGLRRSPKTSVVAPWFRQAQFEFVASLNANVTYGATAHTKGAWQEIHSSTPGNATAVCYIATNNVSANALLDIGVGASGAEVVVVSDLLVGGKAFEPIWIPVAVPSGSRVAVRIQGTNTSPTTSNTGLYLVNSSRDYNLIPTSLDTIGVSTATSAGTALSGASGTWVQITASTAKDYQQVILLNAAGSGTASVTPVYTLGIGAAGSERPLGSSRTRWSSATISSNAANPTGAGALNLSAGPIPAGSRLAVKHDLASNPGNYSVALYGVPYV